MDFSAAATMKEFKLRQEELVGVSVPIVRCHLHDPVLNLSCNGRVYESSTSWEEMFTNAAVRIEELSERALFPRKAN